MSSFLFQVNIYNPFLDHVLTHLRTRFPPDVKGLMLASYLSPFHLDKLTPDVQACLLTTFNDDLPAPTEFDQEVGMCLISWKYLRCEVGTQKHFVLSMVGT